MSSSPNSDTAAAAARAADSKLVGETAATTKKTPHTNSARSISCKPFLLGPRANSPLRHLKSSDAILQKNASSPSSKSKYAHITARVESGWPWRPHSEARRDSSNLNGRGCSRERPRREKAAAAAASATTTASQILVSKEVGHYAMSDHKVARSGSVKPKLSPRRDFGPAQDYPSRRHQSLKCHFVRRPPRKNVDILSTKSSSQFGISYSKLRGLCYCQQPSKVLQSDRKKEIFVAAGLLAKTAKAQLWLGFYELTSANPWLQVPRPCSPLESHDRDPSYFLNSCFPANHLILGSMWDPVMPDPAFDRHFPSYWMDRLLAQTPTLLPKSTNSEHTRPLLRKLDRAIGFPEEAAMMLKDYEFELFGDTSLIQVLEGLARVLTSSSRPSNKNVLLFLKIVSHFYLVSEWVVQLIISKGSHQGRRGLLSCILRLMQASWNNGNFNGVMEILLGLRSPALKPLWLALSGSDAEVLFSSVFRKFFCNSSKAYLLALSKAKASLTKVVPAYLLHIKELAATLQQQKVPTFIVIDTKMAQSNEPALTPVVKLIAEYRGENQFLRRIGPGGLSSGSLKLRSVQKSINTADKALSSCGGRKATSFKERPVSMCDLSQSVIDVAINAIKKTHHGVTIANVPVHKKGDLEILHRGATVLHLDMDTHQVAPVFLKLERCSGTLTWSRPPWKDPRKDFGFAYDNFGSSYTLDTVETAVSPGLRLKYTNRSGESLAYQDEGYVDLAHIKDLKLTSDIEAFSEDIRVSAQRHFQGVIEAKALRLVYGSTLAENRILAFLCPPGVALMWKDLLSDLIASIKTEDPRMVWLKDQYLFLYYQDDLCMGPLAADAIKVFGGRSWSLTGMLKDRGHKGSWKSGPSSGRTKKKSYGNIHSINDRGIHEIYESFSIAGNNASSEGSGSAPSSPWSSPKLGRKSAVTNSPSLDRAAAKFAPLQNIDNNGEDGGKLKYPCTGSITHGSELSFLEFLDLFKSFSLRLRKDIRTLFANHSVCNAATPALNCEDVVKDLKGQAKNEASSKIADKRKAFQCSLTRNSSTDLTDFKSRNEKRKVYNALAAASIFKNSAGVDTSRRQVLPMDAFIHFLSLFQKENLSEEEAQKLIDLHEPDPVLRAYGQLSFEGFARFLMDSSNDAVSQQTSETLDLPISKYYIATSHNTYLTGHQLKGHSSVELYREILLTGCRCVELDCWDGDDGQPIIYHGHTLTTKISFREVVQTIANYAFVASDLPVILSIENHCSLAQQQKMAAIFKELLGDKLVKAPIHENESVLPSPNQLRHRVIIKNKKMRTSLDNFKAALQRTTTLEEAGYNEDEYDSDFGEDEYEDEMQDEVSEQNLSLEEYQQSMRNQLAPPHTRPRTLSVSPSMTLQQPPPIAHHHRASVFLESSSVGSKKKQNCQIARELSDLVVYCQSVKFKGFYKPTPLVTQQPPPPVTSAASATSALSSSLEAKGSTPVRKTGLRSLESTPSSSSGSLNSLNVISSSRGQQQSLALSSASSAGGAFASVNPTVLDLTSPIYQCASLHESRAKTLCRKQPLRMLEHTQSQIVRVYPAGMRIDSSNFNPISVWSCGIQMAAMNYQTVTDPNLHIHNAFFDRTPGYVLKPSVMWNSNHILFERFIPASKTQEGLHVTHISLTIVSGQYVCRESYAASPLVEVEVIGIPRDCSKYKTKMSSRNALNPIWEETFELDIYLPELAFIRFTVIDVTSNLTTAQRVVPVTRLKPGYRHLRLHNEMDQPLPLSQIFLCSQFSDGEEFSHDPEKDPEKVATRKRMSFLVVHDVSESSPYAILKVPENATTRDVIRQACIKAGLDTSKEHEYVLLEEVVHNNNMPPASSLASPNQRMVGMHEMPLQVRNKWRNETKFVLKKVGQDPSWRARLGNLMAFVEEESVEHSSSRNPSEEHRNNSFDEASGAVTTTEEIAAEPSKVTKEVPNADNFLVCVFNVSSKVSYSILQVAKTSSAQDVIAQALSKSRKDSGGERRLPEHFVLVEETDLADPSRRPNKGNKVRRILEPSENVYLVQLSWKGAGRLILEDKEKLLSSDHHGLLTETNSDPCAHLSPSLRRHSRMIASGVRRLSRSFYGGSGETLSSSHHRTGSFAELSGGGIQTRASSSSRRILAPTFSQTQSDGDLTELKQNLDENSPSAPSMAKKLSKINLKKLKIW